MPPKRKRSLKALQQDDVPHLELKDSTMQTSLQMLKLPSPFEFEDDWWSRSPGPEEPGVEQCQQQQVYDDSAMDPLLHFPDSLLNQELSSENMLKGNIYPSAAVAPAFVASDAPPSKKRKNGASTSTAKAVKKNPVLKVDPEGKAISPRESHILSERERRKGMNHLFTSLASLLPDNYSKSDKSTIVSEIIIYIHNLRKDLDELGRKKLEALKSTFVQKRTVSKVSQPSSSTTSVQQLNKLVPKEEEKAGEMRSSQAPNVVLSVCGNDVFITISSSKESTISLFSKVLTLIQKHNLVFVDANISSNSAANFHYFHVKAEISQHLPKDDTLQRQLQSLVTVEGIGPCSLSVSAL